jgi:hypothetical protein
MNAFARRLSRVALALGLTLTTGAFVLTTAAAPANASVGTDIVTTANSQLPGQPPNDKPKTCSDYPANPTNFCSVAWCSLWVQWVWEMSGVPGATELTDDAVSVYRYGVHHGTLANKPHVGDAVVFALNADHSWAAHVGIVTAVNSSTTFTIVAGNSGPQSVVAQSGPGPSAIGSTPFDADQPISTFVRPIRGFDPNGDGHADVVGRSASNHDLYLYAGDGSHTLGAGSDVSNNWSGLDTIVPAGDFNGDGNADILARNASNHDLYLYPGNGNGGYAAGIDIGNNWSGMDNIFAADFNGDGYPDVMARNSANHDLYFYPGNGTGSIGGGTDVSNNWSAFDTIFSPGDFNGDGKADVLARNASNHDLYLYTGNGTGGLNAGVDISNNWSAFDTIFSSGDLNGDGCTDVLARHATSHELYLYPGNCSGGFGAGYDMGGNWSGLDKMI